MKPIELSSNDGIAEGEGILNSILREAVDLISQIDVSARNAARLEGNLVVVMATAEFTDDRFSEYELEIDCHGFVQANIPWPSITVLADPGDSEAVIGPVSLTKSGACVLRPLSAIRQYRLVSRMDSDLLGTVIEALSRLEIRGAAGATSLVGNVEVLADVTNVDGVLEISIAGTLRHPGVQFHWPSVGVVLQSDSDLTFGPKWFDQSGKVQFHLSDQHKTSFVLLTAVLSSMVLVGSAKLLRGQLAPEDSTPNDGAPFRYLATSADNRITVSAWRDQAAEATVYVETTDPELEKAVVSVEFRSNEDEVLAQKTLRLDLEKRGPRNESVYWGEWSGEVALPTDTNIRVTPFTRRDRQK
jgi:hypothetical protein